jgi:hypothetical protein
VLLPWSDAALIAAILIASSLVLSRTDRTSIAAGPVRETGVVLALYALWQWGGELAITNVRGATANALWVWHFERAVHLPSEVSLQHLLLPHGWVVESLNVFYAGVHVPALIIFLIWLYFRHRDAYPRWRNIGALATAAMLAVQLVPVAPPRLMTQLGFVDTALRYGQSVYGPGGIGNATQLAAMPSVHVGWAVFIAMAVITVSTSKWRWLILAHPGVTVLAVVGTANHWWLDGIVAAGIDVLALLVVTGLAAAVALLWPRPAPAAPSLPVFLGARRIDGAGPGSVDPVPLFDTEPARAALAARSNQTPVPAAPAQPP